MPENNNVAFKLKNFEVSEFKFRKIPEIKKSEIEIDFSPIGKYSISEETYFLTLNFKLFNKSSQLEYISATITGFFTFKNVKSLSEIPPYFYKNSIAILYPFLRSFVSTLTLQANIKNVMLPTMNLSWLEPKLKELSQEVE